MAIAERPDFFIAGVAKCGTTALYEYLRRHPSVFMPDRKEPYFFATDLSIEGRVSTLDDYRRLFAPAPAHSLTGEASPFYTFSSVAVDHIMAHNPRAKIIMMLRNPVDAAQSLYTAAWSRGRETAASFEDAWRLQRSRRAGHDIPPHWAEPALLQYGVVYRFATQVRRVIERVPESQRRFVIYEEFFAAPRRHYEQVLEFLDLPAALDTTFDFMNPNSALGPRSHMLDGLLRKPPRWLKALYAPMRPMLRAVGLDAQSVWNRNLAPRPKPALRPEFRAELEEYFADDIEAVERLLGRELWRNGRPEQAVR